MEIFHPLASDNDLPGEDVAASEARCSLALGRLDGMLIGLTPNEKCLLSWALLRSTLLGALIQAGFSDADLRFNDWFAGIDRGPQESEHTACSASALVRCRLPKFVSLTRTNWNLLCHN